MSLLDSPLRATRIFAEIFDRLVANKDVQGANFKDNLIKLICLQNKNAQNIVILIEMMKYNVNFMYLMYNGTGDIDEFYEQCLKTFSYDPSKLSQQPIAPKSNLIDANGVFNSFPIQYSKSKFRNWNKGKYESLFKAIEDFIKPNTVFTTHYNNILRRQFDECSDSVKYALFDSLAILKNEEILVDNLMRVALTTITNHDQLTDIDGYDAAIRVLRSNEMDNYLLCPVCFTNKRRQVVFDCGHKLCLQCYHQLFDSNPGRKARCPTCRHEIVAVHKADKFMYPQVIVNNGNGQITIKQVTVTGLLSHFGNVHRTCPIVSNTIKFDPIKNMFVPMIPNK